MPDLNPTASNVIPQPGYTWMTGVAGESLVRGNAVFLNSNNKLIKSDAYDPDKAKITGIVLNDAALDQPVTIMLSGDLAMGPILAKATTYYASGDPGKIHEIDGLELASFNIVMIGFGISNTIFRLHFKEYGVTIV